MQVVTPPSQVSFLFESCETHSLLEACYFVGFYTQYTCAFEQVAALPGQYVSGTGATSYALCPNG
jgi:hypothetical protein